MSKVRGIRGATTADTNSRDAILDSTSALLKRMVEVNEVQLEDIAAIHFTTTDDLNSEFPALAARLMGWQNLALLGSREMAATDGQPLCIRILMLVNTNLEQADIKFVYLKGAESLRQRGIEGV
jgi:chorismate mutase